MALSREHMQKRMVKNRSDFHEQMEPQLERPEPKEWRSYTDTKLRSMLVRLGVKHPEQFVTRTDMITELEILTEIVTDEAAASRLR